MSRTRVTFWLPKPMNVYTPILRQIVEKGRVELGVTFFRKSRSDCFDDGETGTEGVFDESLLKGYDSEWKQDTLRAGFAAGWREGSAGAGLSVLAGTEHRFSRGFLLASAILRVPVLIRYDATLRARFGSKKRDLARRVALGCLFPRVFRLGYTGEETRTYLRHYGADEEQLWHFPYVIDDRLIRATAAAASAKAALLRADLGLSREAVIVLGAVKFTPREAPLDLVEAFGRTTHPLLHLVLAGDGPLRAEVERRIRDLCPGRVTTLGFIRYRRLMEMYGLADIFAHPARTEVWGVSINEAMAAGVPVIASDGVGAARELIRNGENGFTYSAGDTEALAELIDELAASQDLRHTVRGAGRASIDALSPEMCAERLADLAEAIVDKEARERR